MKSITKIFNIILLLSGLFIYSCTEEADLNLDGKGQTLIKLPDAAEDPEEIGKVSVALDLVDGFKDVVLLRIVRDAPNSSELQKPVVVKIKNDTSVVGAYNREHHTEYESVPAEAYTIDTSNPLANNEWTVSFAAGEFAKEIKIKLNPIKLDLTAQYAFGFSLLSADYGKLSQGLGRVMVEVGAKNRYDGVYEVTGTMVDYVNPALTGYYPFTYELRTSGPHQCIAWDMTVWGDIMHPILSGGAPSGYGAYGLVINFKPDGSGVIESIVNYYGQPAGNTRSAKLAPDGVNTWDPESKKITVKYYMIQTNQSTGTNPRVIFDEVWTYKKAR